MNPKSQDLRSDESVDRLWRMAADDDETTPVDFLRGPAELAGAIREGRPCRLSAELGRHIAELIETLQHPDRYGVKRTLQTSFEPIEPLLWNA